MPTETCSHAPTAADRAWFGERVDELLPDLFGAALRLCRDRTKAEDLVALAVARAWEALPSLEDRDAFRGWVFRILDNAWVSRCRSARARADREPLDASAEQPFSLFEKLHQPFLLWGGQPELDFLDRLLREDIERAIAELPDPFRSVVVLVDQQGMAYRDVAETLDIPVGTVRSRLSRGRSRLQRELWEHAVDAGLRDRPKPPDPSRSRSPSGEDDRDHDSDRRTRPEGRES